MSRINPLRRLYDDLTEKLSKDEVRRLRDLLSEDKITTREKEDLKTPTDIFTKLEKSGQICETDLKLLKDLLETIGRRPLVSEVERVEKELQVWRMERFSDESKVESTDVQFSVSGDVTASSVISSAAVHREMVRTMEDPEGEPTSLQQHIDNHSLRHAQYITTTNVQAKPQLQGQEQADVTTGSPPSKRRKGSAESTCITESKYPDVVLRCEQDLKSLYKKLSEVLPFPWWDGTHRLKLENVYTELELQTKTGEKRDFSRQAIFSSRKDEDSQTTPKRVLIEGDPGYGKSTFCKKLIYDWAKGDTEYLNRFKLMFYFELKDLLYPNAQNIQGAIFNQLLRAVRDESKRIELWKFVQNNPEKVCFVFDGLDEVPMKDLPPYFKEMIAVNCLLPDCPVLVTSRKIRDKNSKQMYDTILEIKGFDYEKAKSIIEKHMNEMNSYGKEVKASDFLQELQKSSHKFVLTDFMQSPLNTLMLCDIWIHSKELPNTRTKLYKEIIDYVVDRYKESHNCDSHFKEGIKQALFIMGEMSFRGLTTDERKVYFSEEDLSHNQYIRELGLVTKVLEFPPTYGFFHLTFQEYFASIYVANLLTNDRCEFTDAIALLSQRSLLSYNQNVFAFLGGNLKNDVDEIFKAMQEKGIFPDGYSFFDPREILYESCCKSTEVIEHCAEFLPEYLIVDLNTMVSHSDSNRLNVNTYLLQCQRTISRNVWLKLSAVNADTIAIYRKCYKALQKTSKKFDSISVDLDLDLNDCNGKGEDYIENLSFINNTQHHSLSDLKPLLFNDINVHISKRVKSSTAFNDRRLVAILKGLSLVSADMLSIYGLPLGNLEFIKAVIGSLSSNEIRRYIYIRFHHDYADYWSRSLLEIEADFGKFLIKFNINEMEFKLVDLHKLLSTYACADNTKLSLKVGIHYNFNTKPTYDVIDMLHRLGSVDIDKLRLVIEGFWDSNRKDRCPKICSNVEATSRVPAEMSTSIGLSPENLDLVKEVRNYVNRNKQVRSISMIFHKGNVDDKKGRDIDTLNIEKCFGKFVIHYNSNMIEFDLADLRSLHSKFTDVETDSVTHNVGINCYLRKRTESDIADILRQLQLPNLGKLEIYTKDHLLMVLNRQHKSLQDLCLNDEDMCAHIRTIVEELSLMSAKEVYIRRLPLGNIETMKYVFGCLRNSQRLGFVSLEFYENCFDIFANHALEMDITFSKFKVRYEMNMIDFKLADLHALFPTSVAGNEGVSPDVSLKCNFKHDKKLDIAEVLSKLGSVEIGQLSLKISSVLVFNLKREEIHCSTTSIMTALSQVSANRLVIKKLPIGNLEFMRNVLGCFSACKLLKTAHMTFCDYDLYSWCTGEIEIYARIGKFHLLLQMNNMPFNLLSLCESLTQCLSLDNNDVTFAVAMNYDLNESTNTELTDIFEELVSVHIAKMSLHMSYGTDISIEDIYSRTSDMLQSLSLINAKSFMIGALPYENVESIKSVHADLRKSVGDKETYISFRPSCCRLCRSPDSELTSLKVTNQKHTCEFAICKSKLDIVSLYQELKGELSTHDQRFLMDALIKCTVNIEDDIRYIVDGSKNITFNKIEYVERSDNRSQAIDVLQKLAEVNTKQFSYKRNNWFGYELTKPVVNAMVQCQSAQAIIISSDMPSDDTKISENIQKLVSDGIIIHGVKLFGRKLAIQGTYAEEANTLSKVIEVEFTLKHELDSDLRYDDTKVSRVTQDDRNAFTNVYMKIFDGLQTISELKYLYIELPVILSTAFQTFYSSTLIIENILDCVLALCYLTEVSIEGGKIISTDNSSEKWIDLCSKESLQMLTFEGCDLNSSCQSMIDSFDKADERRCSQLRITLHDSLCLQNMNLMKDVLLSKGFDLNEACGSASQGQTVFSLKGKSVSIFVSSCANL